MAIRTIVDVYIKPIKNLILETESIVWRWCTTNFLYGWNIRIFMDLWMGPVVVLISCNSWQSDFDGPSFSLLWISWRIYEQIYSLVGAFSCWSWTWFCATFCITFSAVLCVNLVTADKMYQHICYKIFFFQWISEQEKHAVLYVNVIVRTQGMISWLSTVVFDGLQKWTTHFKLHLLLYGRLCLIYT